MSRPAKLDVLAGGGEMAGRIRGFDWSRTPLGPRDRWPVSLRTVVDALVATRFPMAILWGPELILIYNDAYRVICADKHPGALGQSTRDIWSEVWHINEPIFAAVMERGETLSFEGKLFPINRRGFMEDAYFTLCYSPVRIEDNSVGGVLVILEETTFRKPAEEALRESEERFRYLVAASSQALYRMSPDWTEMIELRGGQFLADTQEPDRDWLRKYIHPDDQAWVLQAISEAIREARVFELEHRVLRSDGTLGWTASRAVPVRDAGGKVVEWFGAATDITERKRAVEALHRERSLLDSVMRTTDVMLVLLDPQFNFVWVNPAYARTCGMKPEEMVGKNHFVLYPHQENEAIFRTVRDSGEAVFYKDKPFTFPDQPDRGVTYWDWSLSPIKDGSGRVTGLVFSLRETTRFKQAQEALRLTQASIDGAAEMVAWFRPDGSVYYVNDATCRALGYSREELLAMNAMDFSPGFTRWQYEEHWREVRRHKSLTLQPVHRRKDGTTYTAEVLVNHVAYGGQEFIFAFGRDITDRKKAQEALQESETRFRSIVESTSEGLMLFDSAGNLIYQNPASLRIHGFTEGHDGKMDGEQVPVTWHAWDEAGQPIPFEQWPISRVFRGERFQGQFLRVVRPDTGFEFYGSYNGCPIYGPDGKLALGFITIRDVTQQHKAEENVRQTMAELQRSNRELEQFAYVASHDMKEPLRMVTGFLDLLQQTFPETLDEKARQYVALAAEGGHRMQALLEDLLAYSRAGRGHVLEETDLEAVLDSTLRNLQLRIEEAAATVTHDPLPVLRANRAGMGQVLQNLIGNALKFRSEQPARVHVGARREGAQWVVWVRDNGIGLDMRFADRIFQVFERLHTREKYPGTGIGLAICKKIVEQHGGQIWVESPAGEGATFFFTVPAALSTKRQAT